MSDYDGDGDDNGLPAVDMARQRLIGFLSNWGDGVIETAVVNYRTGESYDLHARDIEALVQATRTVERHNA